MSMRIIFMGTPEFAVASLETLLKDNFQVVAVVTAPDKPAGRGQLVQESAVKKCALKHNLPVLQPSNLKDESFLNQLRELKPDLQIVVAFRMLPEKVWNMPKLGTYNLHASLLPQYRGAAPINWAIMNGDTETGVTTFKLVHEIDAGTILLQKKVSIPENMNAGELHDTLKHEGAKLILQTVQLLYDSLTTGRELNFHQQDSNLVSHAPKLFKESCKINWNNSAKQIYDQIRGLSPYPAAFTELQRDEQLLTLKVFEAKYIVENHQLTNGSLLTDNVSTVKIFVKNGYIEILDIQLQGKKRMKITEFLRGFKFGDNSKFVS